MLRALPHPHARGLAALLPLALAAAPILGGCGDTDFQARKAAAKTAQQQRYDGEFLYRPLTEVEKIERLIQAVRKSDATYLRRDREMTPGLAAAWMERRYFTRWGRQIRTASQFVGIVSEQPMWSSRPFVLRNRDGSEQLVRDYLFERLGELERRPDRVVTQIMAPAPAPAPGARSSGKPPTHPITRAIAQIEAAPDDVRFEFAPRKGAPERLTGQEMAERLRRKTRWIGADLDTVDAWIREIASRDFISNAPYMVIHPGTDAVALPAWLASPAHAFPKNPPEDPPP